VRPSEWVSWLVLGAVFGIPVFRGVGLLRPAQRSLNRLLLRPWGGYFSLALIAAAALALLWTTVPEVSEAGDDGTWELVIAVSAAVSSAACLAAFVPRAVLALAQLMKK
jgi:hypothetical protein